MTGCGYSRRQFLAGTAGFLTWVHQTRIAAAEPGRDPRLVVLNLRGGLDSVGAVAPIGDDAFHKLREGALYEDTGLGKGYALDGLFALHPSLPGLAELYQRGEASIVHATCTPYHERSHFLAQDVLESGLPGIGDFTSGWLNRALQCIQPGERTAAKGLVLKPNMPLLMRGEAEVMTWLPGGGQDNAQDLDQQLAFLYRHSDPDLYKCLETAMQNEDYLDGMSSQAGPVARGALPWKIKKGAQTMGKAMSSDDGPRIGAVELDGWDTHADGMPHNPRFVRLLKQLDEMIETLRVSLGPAWKQTVIVVMTEFGRTMHINGSEGTDHGVGTVAFLVGGAVRGGRVHADWPGLSSTALFEGRDLRPTTDIRAVFKGVLRDHLGIPENALAREVFPLSQSVRPLEGTVLSV